jgi:hypothetical protein
MKTERVFNIFVYFTKGLADEFGITAHDAKGNDADKTALLTRNVATDYARANRFKLSRSFTPEEWLSVYRLGFALDYFELAFQELNAPNNPIFCLTAIVDGIPTVDQQTGPAPLRSISLASREKFAFAQNDYLISYVAGNSFRFTDLINDDYFKAIRLLFNSKCYVSSAKLLMSCIDTLAFVEFGDESQNFINWLSSFVDFTQLGISPNELWEFRNSLIHMSNLKSRMVIKGKLSPIVPFVASAETTCSITPANPKPFNLLKLLNEVAAGISKWGETYNSDPNKLLKFIERYDTTISDQRFDYIWSQKDVECH